MPRTLLFVTDVQLLPLDRGMRVRVSNLLRGCARAFAVTLVAPAPEDPADRTAIERICQRVVWVGEQAPRGARDALGAWWTGVRAAPGAKRPRNVRWYTRYALALRALDPAGFDVVWAERPHVARLFRGWTARTVVDLDDLEHRRIPQELGLAPAGAWARLVAAHRTRLYRRMELEWSRSFLAAIVCSEEDARHLRDQGCRNVHVVPNGVSELVSGAAPPRRERPAGGDLRIAFLGNVAHRPNLDAIDYFSSEVLPLLRAAHPGVLLDVLGPSATPELAARLAGRVRFLGFVPDLRGALAGYDVLVAPIRFGSGTRVKLLDAMACRIPIVTTAIGAEGLPVVDGEHLLLAGGAAELAEQVLRLKRDAALGERLVASAAALVDARYRPAAIQAQVEALLDRLATPAPGGAPAPAA